MESDTPPPIPRRPTRASNMSMEEQKKRWPSHHTTQRGKLAAFSGDFGEAADHCANCGIKGHRAGECFGPVDEDGEIAGCPIHNTLEHDYHECFHCAAFTPAIMALCLWKRRCGKPPLRYKGTRAFVPGADLRKMDTQPMTSESALSNSIVAQWWRHPYKTIGRDPKNLPTWVQYDRFCICKTRKSKEDRHDRPQDLSIASAPPFNPLVMFGPYQKLPPAQAEMTRLKYRRGAEEVNVRLEAEAEAERNNVTARAQSNISDQLAKGYSCLVENIGKRSCNDDNEDSQVPNIRRRIDEVADTRYRSDASEQTPRDSTVGRTQETFQRPLETRIQIQRQQQEIPTASRAIRQPRFRTEPLTITPAMRQPRLAREAPKMPTSPPAIHQPRLARMAPEMPIFQPAPELTTVAEAQDVGMEEDVEKRGSGQGPSEAIQHQNRRGNGHQEKKQTESCPICGDAQHSSRCDMACPCTGPNKKPHHKRSCRKSCTLCDSAKHAALRCNVACGICGSPQHQGISCQRSTCSCGEFHLYQDCPHDQDESS